MPRQYLSFWKSNMKLTGVHFQLCVWRGGESWFKKSNIYSQFCIVHKNLRSKSKRLSPSERKPNCMFGLIGVCTPWMPVSRVNQIQCHGPLYISVLTLQGLKILHKVHIPSPPKNLVTLSLVTFVDFLLFLRIITHTSIFSKWEFSFCLTKLYYRF